MKLRYQDKVEKHLLSGKSITDEQCRVKFGGHRLASVIHRLREKHRPHGITIATKIVTKKKEGYSYAKYYIEK